MLKNTHDAEDITADVFMELWRRFDNFKSSGHIEGFLIVTAKNRCLNHLLKNNKIKFCELHDDLTDYAEINSKVIDTLYIKIKEEVERLPWRQRDIGKLILSGLTSAQIADKLGINYKTVCNLKGVIIATLRLNLRWYIKEYVNID